ncbi:Ras-related protein Rab-21 [Ananas comosus]|uniref:Ras-related protein Rab-21 n=1 Tax=Ananas comosus TaxID=4615 RepID=A0A199UQB8_ANACO|nr:Ras-related protein Rab-21 [Ananas comosus]
MSSRPPNLTFKLVLLGDGRVGKTSLVLRYVIMFSPKNKKPRSSFLSKETLVIEGVPVTCLYGYCWTGKVSCISPIYYRDADAALLVYDITDSDTSFGSKKLNIQEAESCAEAIGAKLFVTSAKSGAGTDDVFLYIAKRLMEKRKSDGEGLLPTPPRKGIIVIDDEPEREPPAKLIVFSNKHGGQQFTS